jgi:hypothetical protein
MNGDEKKQEEEEEERGIVSEQETYREGVSYTRAFEKDSTSKQAHFFNTLAKERMNDDESNKQL